MNNFTLHPVLAKDCHQLGVWQKTHILLHKDAHVRWFILVPEVSQNQWHELPSSTQGHILAGVMALSALLTGALGCDKVNLGAIGNMVPQFHFHVVGRWQSDPYWPGVVWGKSFPGCAYTKDQVQDLQTRALAALQSSEF